MSSDTSLSQSVEITVCPWDSHASSEPTCLKGQMSMGLSRIFGAYMSERAERERRLKEMEEAINNNVDPIIFFI